MNKLPDWKMLDEWFYYDGESLRWKNPGAGRTSAGDIAGAVVGSVGSHYQVKVKGRRYYVHRIIWKLVTGADPIEEIDHIDHNGLNNAWSNLREVLRYENKVNLPRYKNNSTGVIGVSMSRNKYRAKIRVLGKDISLGSHSTLEQAATARKAAERKYGFHENHGAAKSN